MHTQAYTHTCRHACTRQSCLYSSIWQWPLSLYYTLEVPECPMALGYG